jgi:hypothetical protein
LFILFNFSIKGGKKRRYLELLGSKYAQLAYKDMQKIKKNKKITIGLLFLKYLYNIFDLLQKI